MIKRYIRNENGEWKEIFDNILFVKYFKQIISSKQHKDMTYFYIVNDYEILLHGRTESVYNINYEWKNKILL